tara:strand:- start:610 stop:924 length:315 start_codon:yes stop_codon:yes gene_type:complete
MPTYSFENTKTGEQFDDMMSISEKEAYLEKNPHIKQMISQINIVSGVVGMGRMKNDQGWKEMQSRIAEAHPASEFAKQHGKKSIKQIKTQQVVEKHRKRQQGKK